MNCLGMILLYILRYSFCCAYLNSTCGKEIQFAGLLSVFNDQLLWQSRRSWTMYKRKDDNNLLLGQAWPIRFLTITLLISVALHIIVGTFVGKRYVLGRHMFQIHCLHGVCACAVAMGDGRVRILAISRPASVRGSRKFCA